MAVHSTKSHDYAKQTDPFSNFAFSAHFTGLTRYEMCDFNEVQKLARLMALRQNGRAPQNETVEDTYLDKAVYAILAFAIYLQETSKGVAPAQESVE